MPKFLPFFPLNMVAFPGEEIRLHIFEPRYKQLIKECIEEGKSFGITPSFAKGMANYGTEMEMVKIEGTTATGEMDILVKGVTAYKTLEYLEEVPDKLYSAGIIAYFDKEKVINDAINKELTSLVAELHSVTGERRSAVNVDGNLTSYSVAHSIGLDIQKKLDLLSISQENDRSIYLINHLKLMLPIASQAKNLKYRSFLN